MSSFYLQIEEIKSAKRHKYYGIIWPSDTLIFQYEKIVDFRIKSHATSNWKSKHLVLLQDIGNSSNKIPSISSSTGSNFDKNYK